MKRQAPPSTAKPAEPDSPKDAWDDESPAADDVESFPTLGGSSSAPQRGPVSWGAPTSSAASQPKVAPKPKPSAPVAEDFPSLGGAKSSSAGSGWAAAAKARA